MKNQLFKNFCLHHLEYHRSIGIRKQFWEEAYVFSFTIHFGNFGCPVC